MPREEKQGRRAFPELAGSEAGPTASRPGGISGRPSRHDAPTRWFAAAGAEDEPPAAPGIPVTAYAAPIFVLGALLSAVLVHGATAHVLLPIACLAAAGVAAWPSISRRLYPLPPGPVPRSSRGLELDGERLAFHPGRSAAPASARGRAHAAADSLLLLLDAPFGVTLLSSPRRDRLIAMLTSASGTFFLGAAFDAAARRAFAPLLDRAYTVAGDDAGIEPVGPDGEQLVLPPDELASLLDSLVERSPACLDRFVLTDARGASLTLDSRQLCVGDRSVDLNAPLEWKPIVFQEAFGQAIAVYQGTWIRQSGTEMVLVSLLPALGPAIGADVDQGSLDRSVLRDLRLMQASPEAPPPAEQRVAIDRLFMLPVRSALDRAPRASHQPNRAQV